MLRRERPSPRFGRHDWLVPGGQALLLLLIAASLVSLWSQLRRAAPELAFDRASLDRIGWVLAAAELVLVWRICAHFLRARRLYRAARTRPARESPAAESLRGTPIDSLPPGITPGEPPLD